MHSMYMWINYTAVNSAKIVADPDSRARLVLGVNYTLFALALTAVVARTLVKIKLQKLGTEDVLILISTAIMLVLMVLTTVACKYGFGMHTTDFRPEWELTYNKLSYTMVALSGICYPLAKVSVLFFHIRFGQQRTFISICYVTIGYIVLSSAAVTLITLFGCTPIYGAWDRTVPANCVDTSLFFYVYLSRVVCTGVMLLLLPIPLLMRVKLQKCLSFGLGVMYAAGMLIAGISAYGVHTVYVAYMSPDGLWDSAWSWMWVLIEFNVGTVATCMPSMVMVFRWVRGDYSTRKAAVVAAAPVSAVPGEIVTFGGGGGRKHPVFADELDLLTVSSASDWEEVALEMMETGMAG